MNAIPKQWKMVIQTHPLEDSDTPMSEDILTVDKLIDIKKPCNYLYKCLQTKLVPKADFDRYHRAWVKRVNPEILSEAFKLMVKNVNRITSVVKLRNFQYKLLLGKIYTNTTLSKWKIVSSDNCNLCNLEPQHVRHLFVECPRTKILWNYVELDATIILENRITERIDSVEHFIILVTKFYIFRCKCIDEKPSVTKLQLELLKWKKIDIYNAQLHGKLLHVQNKWRGVKIEHILDP